MSYLGDKLAGDTIYFKFTSVNTSGVPTAITTPVLAVYKNNSTTESQAGLTVTADFDSLSGLNHVTIDTSQDGTFYANGNDFQVVVVTGTVSGNSIVGYVVREFSLANRSALRPTTAGRTLDVSAGGEAGIDWANIGSPTTTVNLSGTTVKDATDVETKLGTPAGASVSADIAAIEAQTDDIGAAGAGLTAIPWNAAWDAEVESEVTDALNAYDPPTRAELTTDTNSILSKLLKYVQLILRKDTAIATDNATELTAINADGGSGAGAYANTTDSQEALRDRGDAAWITATGFSTLDAAGVRSAVGLASANLDTQLDALPTAAENADAVWDEILSGHLGAGSTGEALNAAGAAGDPWTTALPGAYGAGSAGNIIGNNLNATVSSRASQTSLDTLDDFVDTEVSAILADTNELQTDWANGGRLDNILDARASQASVDTVDTVVDAILADTGTDGVVVAASSKTGYALSAAGIQAIWDALTSALTTAGSIGKLLVDNINATISSRSSHSAADVWAVATRLLTAGTNIVLAKGTGVTGFNDLSAAQVNTEVDTALGDVGLTTTITGRIDAAVSTRATPAQVNTEVVDALSVDTYAEPGQGAPPATTTLANKINYQYKGFRNRYTQTSSEFKLYADDGTTVDQKATVSDDLTTFDRGEIGSGP